MSSAREPEGGQLLLEGRKGGCKSVKTAVERKKGGVFGRGVTYEGRDTGGGGRLRGDSRGLIVMEKFTGENKIRKGGGVQQVLGGLQTCGGGKIFRKKNVLGAS